MIDVLRFGFGKKELVKMTPEERTRDLENPSASVHLKRFSTPSLTLKFLCAGKLNPRIIKFVGACVLRLKPRSMDIAVTSGRESQSVVGARLRLSSECAVLDAGAEPLGR
jgi:hypothetical protein